MDNEIPLLKIGLIGSGKMGTDIFNYLRPSILRLPRLFAKPNPKPTEVPAENTLKKARTTI